MVTEAAIISPLRQWQLIETNRAKATPKSFTSLRPVFNIYVISIDIPALSSRQTDSGESIQMPRT